MCAAVNFDISVWGGMSVDQSLLLEMYRRMGLVRQFDEAVQKLFNSGRIPGSAHLSIGQEGEVVGACMALRDDDYMVGNHRSHGHPIGKGAGVNALMAEILGKSTGVNQGKGGSMHLADFSVGSLGESSIVGSGLPVAVGAALGSQMQGNDRVTLCFFGDGASNQGYFHEAMNMAALWKLPVVFLCENNGYGVTTPNNRAAALEDISARAAGYGTPSSIVDGQQCLEVYDAVTEAVERARRGDGPTLVEAKTYRYHHHSEGPLYDNMTYRSDEELAAWKLRDPLLLFRELLADSVAVADLDRMDEQVKQDIAAALEFAEQSPLPEPEEAYTHLYRTPVVVIEGELSNG